jgi:hypothetical protein
MDKKSEMTVTCSKDRVIRNSHKILLGRYGKGEKILSNHKQESGCKVDLKLTVMSFAGDVFSRR